MKITGIKYIGFEFDFGYSEENEADAQNKGRIDAEVFVNVTDDGEDSIITHKVRLDETSFLDLMEVEGAEEIDFGSNFSGALQQIRMLIALKVADDLGIEIVDMDFIKPTPLCDEINSVKERTQATEDALLLLMTEGVN